LEELTMDIKTTIRELKQAGVSRPDIVWAFPYHPRTQDRATFIAHAFGVSFKEAIALLAAATVADSAAADYEDVVPLAMRFGNWVAEHFDYLDTQDTEQDLRHVTALLFELAPDADSDSPSDPDGDDLDDDDDDDFEDLDDEGLEDLA
jgi:hypothetical protein